MKSVQRGVSSARENVTKTNNALIQTNNKISKVIESINQLNLIVYDINRSRNTALEFIHSLTEKFNVVIDKKKSFEETYKRSLDSVKRYYSLRFNAEKYDSKGLEHLHEVLDGYQFSQTTMTSTKVISNLAELLIAMKRDAESFAKRHAKSSANFLEVMGGDVSVATVDLCREMSSNCVQCTKNFDDLAKALLQAKKYFDSYVGLNEYRWFCFSFEFQVRFCRTFFVFMRCFSLNGDKCRQNFENYDYFSRRSKYFCLLKWFHEKFKGLFPKKQKEPFVPFGVLCLFSCLSKSGNFAYHESIPDCFCFCIAFFEGEWGCNFL